MTDFKIAIDGTSGSGKSTISKKLAKRLNIKYINTGLMYRAATFFLIKENIIDDEQKSLVSLKKIKFEYLNEDIIKINDLELKFQTLMNEDISKQIYKIANSILLRPILVGLQKEISRKYDSLLMEGRDITTVIMKECKNKFYITAPVDVRTQRRMKQLGLNQNEYVNIKNKIIKRDNFDVERIMGPLKIDNDAFVIDTSKQNIDETIKLIISKLK